jgi:peptide/nickel transport system permease protein
VLAYIIRRLLWLVLLLVIVSAVTFVIFYALPSADPAVLRAGKQPDPELVERIRKSLGFDKSLLHQYWIYMKNLILHFDFGYSYQNAHPVREEITSRLPATISLTAGAAVIWVLIGVPLGVLCGAAPGSKRDRLAMGGALLAVSAPVYWLGLVMLYLFAKDVGVIKLFDGAGTYVPISEDPLRWFGSLLLPCFVLALSFAAFYVRILRSSMIEVLGQDYIRTARAKGLSQRRILWKHALRSAGTPVVTILALDVGTLLGGAILTETVFNIPGVGLLAYDAIQNADLPLIQGTVLFGAFFIVLFNLVADVVYALLDPRIRYR